MNINLIEIFSVPIKSLSDGIKLFCLALTNFKLYNRYCKIQYVKAERQRIKREEKEKTELEEMLKNAERINRIKKFSLRRKPNLLHFYKNLNKIKKTIYNILKPILSFILQLIGWGILFGLICMLASYNTYDSKVDLWIAILIYIWTTLSHKCNKINYKTWQEKAKTDDFYNYFCSEWKPHVSGYLVAFWFGLKFCNNFEFIIIMIMSYCLDLWDRRYITQNIKQDMILKKLKRLT